MLIFDFSDEENLTEKIYKKKISNFKKINEILI